MLEQLQLILGSINWAGSSIQLLRLNVIDLTVIRQTNRDKIEELRAFIIGTNIGHEKLPNFKAYQT